MSNPSRRRHGAAAASGAVLFVLALLLLATPLTASAAPADSPPTIQPTWAKTITWGASPSVEKLTDLAVSKDGTMVWACGSTGPGDSDVDIALVRIATSGARSYKYTWGGPRLLDDVATAVATAPDGSVYTAGYSTRKLANPDIILIKWSRLGKVLWTRPYAAGPYGDAAVDVVVDRFGNVTVCGTGGGATGTAWVLASWSTDGKRRWVRTFTCPVVGPNAPNELVADKDGSLYVTGTELLLSGHYGSRTIKYSRAGARLWNKAWTPGDGTGCMLDSVVRRPGGGVYVGGSEENGGAIVVRYSSAGAASRVVTGTTRFWVEDLALAGRGGLVLGGAGLMNPYVERYSSLGTVVRSWIIVPELDPQHPSTIASVAADNSGRVYWAGHATGTDAVLVGCAGTAATPEWTGGWAGGAYQPMVVASVWSGGSYYVAGVQGIVNARQMFVLKYKQ